MAAKELAFEAKQAGAAAFSRAVGQDLYDVLLDDYLCGELTALWECATWGALQAHVAQNDAPPAAQAYLQAVGAQIGGQPSQPQVEQTTQSVSLSW